VAESVLCHAFPSKTPNCPGTIMLPIDTFERIFPDRGVSANDDLSVILVCDSCKHANIYSSDRRSQYRDPNLRQVSWVHTGETKIELWLKCGGGKNEFQVPVVVTWNEGRLDEEKPQICESWIGGHL